jgi:hypothetical protein
MSFTLYNNNYNNDTWKNYDTIGKEFCRYFYNLYDNDFNGLEELYSNNTCITYNGIECASFVDLAAYLNSEGLWRFIHYEISGTSQPILDSHNNGSLLITTSGSMSINDSNTIYNFNESIVLEKNMYGNYCVANHIFKVL